MTSATDSSIGTIWLGRATSPSVANTAVSASPSGMSAPTSEPNTSSRIRSVIGIEIRPARASCELNIASSALPVDAEPASTTV